MSTGDMYDITWEGGHTVAVLRLQGFWNDKIMDDFSAALAVVLQSTRRAARPTGMLVNAVDLPVQSQAITKRHEALFLEFSGAVEFVALVVSSALIRLQSGRLASAGSYTMFNAESEARQWLAEQLNLPAIAQMP